MISLLLAVALAFTPENAHRAYVTACDFVKGNTPRDAGTIRGRIAANFILDRASETGADVRRDAFTAMTPKGEKQFTNLYSEFKRGDDLPWVVLVSHYDTKPGTGCPGANDGAATTALLISLADALCSWPTPRGNVLLVWTDGEECMSQYTSIDGLWGSKRAVEYVRGRNLNVRAVIAVDMIGDRDLHISIPGNGTPTLAKIAEHAARLAGYPGLVTRTTDVVKDDHVPFLAAGYKAIDLIDFNYGPDNAFWHTANDTMENVSEQSLLKAGQVLAQMLNILLSDVPKS